MQSFEPEQISRMVGRRPTSFVVTALTAVLVAACTTGSPTTGSPTTPTQTPAATGATPTGGGDLVPLTSFYTSVSAGVLPIWIAEDEGLFEKYGIDHDLQFLESSTAAAQAMAAGQVNIGSSGGSVNVAATLAGGDQMAIATTISSFVLFILGAEGIDSMEDLRGQTLAVTRIGSLTDVGARVALEQAGLEPDVDVTILATGGMSSSIAALESGQAQAASLTMPSSILAERDGFNVIADLGSLGIPYWQEGIAANASWIEDNRELAKNYLRAYLEGLELFRTDEELRTATLVKWAEIADETVAEEAATYYAQLIPDDPAPTEEQIATALSHLDDPAAETADPADFIDASLIEELRAEGFEFAGD